MIKSRRIAWVVVVATAVIGMAGNAVFAADPPAKIGVVDLNKVHQEAPRIKQYWDEIQKFKESLEAKLEVRIQNVLLNGNEIEELVSLKTKTTALTDQEKNRMKELVDAQDSRAKELSSLEQDKNLDAVKTARMKELQDARKKSEDTGMALTKDYDAQLKSKVGELDKLAEADLRDAIGKVAAAKGFTIIVAKEAVLFGGTDISQDVIGKLDRKAQ